MTEPVPAPQTAPCGDVLVPAALDHQVTGTSAPSIKAKIVAEAATGPTTEDVDGTLN